jgi:hypothetical protein
MQLEQTLAQFALALFIAGAARREFLGHCDASARAEFARG